MGHEGNDPELDKYDEEEQARLSIIDQKICSDLHDKLAFFQQLAESQISPEDVVTARIQCLSTSKVLVTIHR